MLMINQMLIDNILEEAASYNTKELSEAAKRVLDKFTKYSDRNVYLCYRQYGSSGRFVATKEKWESEFNRYLKLGATPIYISTKGFPLFVYDYADTDGEKLPHSDELYDELYPFKSWGGYNCEEYKCLVDKIVFRGIEYVEKRMSFEKGGYHCQVKQGGRYTRYGIVVNSNYDTYSKTIILFHELAHVFLNECREKSSNKSLEKYYIEELEASLVTYILCTKLGLDTCDSIKYVSRVLHEMNCENIVVNLPNISNALTKLIGVAAC